MAFGKPSYDGATSFKKIQTLSKATKDGKSVVFRILPPIKSLAEKGTWGVRHAQHFGYTLPNPKDPSKPLYRTFACMEKVEFRDGEKHVIRQCPECEEIKRRKDKFESLKQRAIEAKKTPAEIATALGPNENWLDAHNLDVKYYVNVKDVSGNFYTLALPPGVYGKIRSKVTEMVKPKRGRPYDPIAPEQGVYWEIHDTGGRASDKYEVAIVKDVIDLNGEQVEKTKVAPLSDGDDEKAEAACYDLADIGIRKLSYDRVKALVQDCDNPENVKAIFAAPERAEVSPVEVEEVRDTPKATPSVPKVKASPAIHVTPTPTPVVQTPESSPEVEQSPGPISKVSEPSDVPSVSYEMSDEDFEKLFAPKK